MKSLSYIVICFLVVSLPAFSQPDSRIDPSGFEKLNGYLKQVSIKKKLPTPEHIYAVERPKPVRGNVRHVMDDVYGLWDEKDSVGMKIQASCTEYWFDKSGKLTRGKFYKHREGEMNYLYNRSQQLEKVITIYKDGKVDSLVFIYDENGLVRDRRQYSNGRIVQRVVVNYDSISRPTEEYGINPYDLRVFVTRYFYTGASSNPDSIRPETADLRKFYYRNGRLVGKVYVDRSTRRVTFREFYNSKEEIIEQSSSDPTNPTLYRYIYDKRGNWTKRTQVYRGKPDSYIRRKIEYY